jgi:16S rRNA (adenine1518-N6/adenine1519-N6)-dimethyltransferase
MVTTVQYEVAERIVATPNDMNLLAVGVQLYGSPQIIRRLSPGIFYPQPRVDSALLRIDPHPDQPIPSEERKQFFRMVRAGFSQPRKQVKNALAAGLHLDRAVVVNWLHAAELDPRRRAETLSLEDWLTLHDMADRYLKTI